jgi:hypothetical protein
MQGFSNDRGTSQTSKGMCMVFSVFRNKFPIFLAFPWAATAGKIGLKQQSLGSRKNPNFSN